MHQQTLRMENLIEELGVGIPAIFDSSEFRSKIQALEEELKTKNPPPIT